MPLIVDLAVEALVIFYFFADCIDFAGDFWLILEPMKLLFMAIDVYAIGL